MPTRLISVLAAAAIGVVLAGSAASATLPPPDDSALGEAFLANDNAGNANVSAIAGLPGSGGGDNTGGGEPHGYAPGEGTGAPIGCPGRSHAPAGAVEAVRAALQAGTSPVPADPTQTVDILQGPGAAPDRVVNESWFKMEGGVPHVKYSFTCTDPFGFYSDWLPVTLAGEELLPQPRPEQFVPELYDRVVRQLPTPVPGIAPADWMPERWTYVNMPTFFWIEQRQGQWAPVTAEASVPGLTVTARADPEALIVYPGDGSRPVRCNGPQPAFRENRDNPETFRGCQHIYYDSSAMADNGETFPLVVEVVWRGSWSASNGQSGRLGTVSTVSPTRWLPVAEIQAVIVDRGG